MNTHAIDGSHSMEAQGGYNKCWCNFDELTFWCHKVKEMLGLIRI